MSQSSSPFSQPSFESTPPLKPGLGTASVIAICITLLLMCGGVLTFAYLAVDRLATAIEEIDYSDYEDEETPRALMFALADVDSVKQRVGTLESIEVDDHLTYDVNNENPEYYYTVTGDAGQITIAVWFDEDENSERWFDRIAIVDEQGEVSEQLAFAEVPFDATFSIPVWEQLNGHAQIESSIGSLQYVATDWESSMNEDGTYGGDEAIYFFDLRGSDGEAKVKVTFDAADYETIEAMDLVDDAGGETPIELNADQSSS